MPILGKDTIHIYGVNASFTSNKELLCDSGLMRFTNTTVSNDLITRYQWVFGDGQTSPEKNPDHVYKQLGLYTLQLTADSHKPAVDMVKLPLPLKIIQSPLAALFKVIRAPVFLLYCNSGAACCGPIPANLRWQWDFEMELPRKIKIRRPLRI